LTASAGVSIIDKQSYDLAIHFKAKISGVKIKAGAGWSHGAGAFADEAGSNSQDFNQLDGSVSVLTPFGLGATFSGGKQWIDERDSTLPERSPSGICPDIVARSPVKSIGRRPRAAGCTGRRDHGYAGNARGCAIANFPFDISNAGREIESAGKHSSIENFDCYNKKYRSICLFCS